MAHKKSALAVDDKTRDGSLSPGWTVLEQPIPIGGSILPTQSVPIVPIKECDEDNASAGPSAMYVTSQSDNTHDVMDQIANEFQRAAKSRRSHNNQDESSSDDRENEVRINGQRLEDGNAEQPLMEEDTEVWTGAEDEQRVFTVGNSDPTFYSIAENTETTVREDTDTTNTISLSSDGGSNTEMPMIQHEARPVDNAEEQACGVSDTIQKPCAVKTKPIQQVIASSSNSVPFKAASKVQHNTGTSNSLSATAPSTSSRAVNQPSVVGQSMTMNNIQHGRPPDGRPPNNRRWNFSVNDSQSVRVDHPGGSVPETNGVQHKALLEIMSLGLGNFTNDMATIVIDKLRPEYDVIAKRVGQAVKEETTAELTELRQKVEAAEKLLNHLELEKNKLHDELVREKEGMRKEIDKEKAKRMKENEQKDEQIDKLEKELKKIQMMNREKDRMSRRAESKAKSEEHRRIQAAETYDNKMKELQKEISKLKSEVLVQKSKNRVQSASTREMVKSGSLARKLKSYHENSKGKWPLVHPKHVPYDEGDP